ncbi:membrane progestin receptor beta-like [Saccostrea cucullata]|uniref:membrane progestin receptor beta-like n=1 Tax=Saccostrea cuccullata TaxID=36930 RepID=UPI002ED40F5E
MGQDRFLCLIKSHVTQARVQPTLLSDQVDPLFREPGILSGYRPSGQGFIYYIASILHIHNETVNIWTHLVGFFLILYRWLSLLYDPASSSEFLPVITAFSLCCLAYTFCSTLAHTLHSKSPDIHYLCFQIDYAGIGFYTLGCSIYVFYVSCYHQYFVSLQCYFLPSAVIMSTTGCLCCCIAKLKYTRPYPFRRKLWQLFSFGTQTVLVFFLVAPRYADCASDPECHLSSLSHHSNVVAFITTSVFFFSSHVPDKLIPGKVDIIGQGHQIFHVLCVVGTLLQFDTIVWDIKHHATMEMVPSTSAICIAMFSYLILVICIIYTLRPFVADRIQKDVMFKGLLNNKLQ